LKSTAQKLAVIVAGVSLVATLATKTQAATYPGNATTFSSASTNKKSLFSISGSTLNITGDSTGTNKWYAGTDQIVGIRSVFLVTFQGKAPTGISATSGYIAPNSTSASHTAWTTFTSSGFSIFDNGSSGNGFNNGSDYLLVAPASLAGKTGTNTQPFGSFKFSGPLVDSKGKPLYDLGLDILIGGATGSTKRVYFSLPANVAPVPEASTFAIFGLLGALFCVQVYRKKTRPQVEA
jgi:hypothetical protein